MERYNLQVLTGIVGVRNPFINTPVDDIIRDENLIMDYIQYITTGGPNNISSFKCNVEHELLIRTLYDKIYDLNREAYRHAFYKRLDYALLEYIKNVVFEYLYINSSKYYTMEKLFTKLEKTIRYRTGLSIREIKALYKYICVQEYTISNSLSTTVYHALAMWFKYGVESECKEYVVKTFGYYLSLYDINMKFFDILLGFKPQLLGTNPLLPGFIDRKDYIGMMSMTYNMDRDHRSLYIACLYEYAVRHKTNVIIDYIIVYMEDDRRLRRTLVNTCYLPMFVVNKLGIINKNGIVDSSYELWRVIHNNCLVMKYR